MLNPENSTVVLFQEVPSDFPGGSRFGNQVLKHADVEEPDTYIERFVDLTGADCRVRFLPGHAVFNFAGVDATEKRVHLLEEVCRIVALFLDSPNVLSDFGFQLLIDCRAHGDASFGDCVCIRSPI